VSSIRSNNLLPKYLSLRYRFLVDLFAHYFDHCIRHRTKFLKASIYMPIRYPYKSCNEFISGNLGCLEYRPIHRLSTLESSNDIGWFNILVCVYLLLFRSRLCYIWSKQNDRVLAASIVL
jgi:hypothetical protein